MLSECLLKNVGWLRAFCRTWLAIGSLGRFRIRAGNWDLLRGVEDALDVKVCFGRDSLNETEMGPQSNGDKATKRPTCRRFPREPQKPKLRYHG